MHQVGDLFELNIKLRCQNVKEVPSTAQFCSIELDDCE
jgi:hypothetical protein